MKLGLYNKEDNILYWLKLDDSLTIQSWLDAAHDRFKIDKNNKHKWRYVISN